jgi:hypothetical protein
MPQKTVFISYSHKDLIFLNQLKRHFASTNQDIEYWDDSKILPGKKWKEEILNKLKKSSVAILLISADFLNSNFITTVEIPELLNRAAKQGLLILTIVLKPCLFEDYPEISQYQAVNSPDNPIIQMTESDQENMWIKTVRAVKRHIKNQI